MADPVISAFMQVVFQGILDFVNKELNSDYALRCDCKRLISIVEMIQPVLREAENAQVSDSVKLLFDKLEDAGYDAMEVLDEASYESIRHQVIHFAPLRNLPIISVINPSRMKFRHDMENGIKDVFQKIDDITKCVHFPKLAESNRERPDWSTPQQTCLRQTHVFGRKNDQEKIVKMLLQSDLKSSITVLPIVGEPYIGKTVVTKEVFSDEQVKRHFNLRLWVHVSDHFDIQKITESIIEESIENKITSRNDNYSKCGNLNTLQMRLQKQLQGERYLLVLDNYSSEKRSDWDNLRLPLLTGATGSKIIVTTRSDHVVGVVSKIPPYRLQGLAPDDCWLLFCQCAQTEGNNSGDSLPNRLKEEIVQKCMGVPFIAASLGHKVRQERDTGKWVTIVGEEHWNSGSDNDFIRSLRLKYMSLESHQKSCFAYSSVIPPKYLFNEEWLIQHWIAQGFIDKEETGKSCFRSLVERSFFQLAVVDPTGGQHRYILSQMMRLLALDVSGGNCKCYVMGMERRFNNQQKVRHLTVDLNKQIDQKMLDVIPKSKILHTLIVVGGSEDSLLTIPNDIEQRFPKLHTLDLSYSSITELPGSIGKLKHLRCLQLQSTKIRQLPETICDLYLLQTLGLRNCECLEELPRKIKYLHKLRHIDLVNVFNLTCMPKDIGLLTELQTLSRFVISEIRHKGGIGELANLNELNGELLISGLEHVNDVKEAADAHLDYKKLRKIRLSWSAKNNKATQIMEHLKPPIVIEELTILGHADMACPGWLASPDYKNLITLQLYEFKSCTVVPCLGQLPLLENLCIKEWDELESMSCSTFCGGNTANFQSLKKLHLERLGKLQRWDGDDRCAFPSLLELIIKNCNKLEQLTHNLPSLTKITVEGSPNLYGLRKFPSLTHVDVTASGNWILRSLSSLASPISITLGKLPTLRLPSGSTWFHSSLQHLHISHCDLLESMPEDWPSHNLTHFSVSHCPQLRELPSGIRHLQALENLEISGCGNLIGLPDMDGLTALLWMEISACGSIRSLPVLPSSMQFLSIKGCPQLTHSCLTKGSLDRYKINHIFSVWIDDNEVFTSADEPRFVIPAKKLQQFSKAKG
ncbi:hypothetical protein GUJ93_ZPchr0012g19036 [Zizania palustris]|uniref:NB-ARC domain-containing protein n=1 Tax=Zizania palustris TaxID=103762 RepID=A0A8J5WNH1_ZIZPA|nr:hypothetical protein GUJ93_ZPchr0012g19036 [Zizania palustris]